MKGTQSNCIHNGGGGQQHVAVSATGSGSCESNGKIRTVRRRSSRRLNNGDASHFDEQNEMQTFAELHQPNGVIDEPIPAGANAGMSDADVPTRTQILKDPANLCTLAGAILASLAMASMWQGRYYVGMCLNVAANIADILDGPIARATPNRHPAFSVVGCKLDCYSDLVSHFVVPASLLMHLSNMHPVCATLAAFHICAGILRQSYFEITGRCEGGTCIYGMTSDYMVGIYTVVMHVCPIVGLHLMPLVLSACVVVMIFSSLTFSIRSRRYDGFGLFTVTAYNVLLCASCLVLVLFQEYEGIDWISGFLFIANLILAYPCYFRFVELNR